ncbi:Der GTPase-activating protein YihI [Neptunicella sp. SCSIO 80796]|uniref:Der GTPase-activating protein YihI n=1 Tax=Neptunicella plasticusilytica TaxID=3117012 RepID=UPI003A4D46B4
MPKIKKTRKVGRIGVRSVPKAERVREAKVERKKKANGRPAGSRQNVETGAKLSGHGSNGNKDPRLGSKKPVALIASEKSAGNRAKPKKYFSPTQELEALENDPRLEKLLNLLDEGKTLSAEDQQFVDKQLARHKQLCDLLDIQDETLQQGSDDEDIDLLEQLERNNLDKFK